MRGLGRFLPQENRAIDYTATNTVTGESNSWRLLLPQDCGLGFGPGGPYGGGMQLPAAWRASTLISDLIGQLPWAAYRERAGQPAARINPSPPLLADPSPGRTRMETMSSLALDLLWNGNAVAVVGSRNAEGWPTSLVPVPASLVGVRYLRASEMYGLDGTIREPIEYQIGNWKGGPSDVLHVRGPCEPGALRGLGVLEAGVGVISLATEQERQARGINQHGVPTGILKATTNSDITPQELIDARDDWQAARRTSTVAALPPGVDFMPISWSPTELQMLEARRFSDEKIAQLFGLPLRYLGAAVGGLTYSNPTADAVDLLKFTLGGHLARFEQELSRLMPRGTWAKANVDMFHRSDMPTRYAAHKTAIEAGWLSVAEVRALEDLPPLPEEVPAPAPDETVDDVIDDETDEDDPTEESQ